MGMADVCLRSHVECPQGWQYTKLKPQRGPWGEEKLCMQQRKPAADQAGELRTRRREAREVRV